jgi:hypothetical protein
VSSSVALAKPAAAVVPNSSTTEVGFSVSPIEANRGRLSVKRGMVLRVDGVVEEELMDPSIEVSE